MASADLAITLSVRMGKMEAELAKATQSMRNTERQAKQTATAVAAMGSSFATVAASASGAFRSLGATITGIVAVVAGGGLVAGISAAVSRVNALADAAAQVGVSVEELQTVQVAFEEAGSNAQAAEQALGRLGVSIGDAVSGSKAAQEQFVAMGISFRNVDGSARSTVQVFDDIAAKMAEASSEQEKLSIAATFFGQRGARAAVAAMNEMGGATAAATERMRALGLIASKETTDALDQVGTGFANVARAISVVMANAIAQAAPGLVDFLTRVRESVVAAGPAILDGLSSIGSQIGAAVSGWWEEFRPLRESLMALFRDLGPVVVNVARIVGETFIGVARSLQPVAVFIIDTLRNVIRWVTDALKALGLVERSGLELAQRGVQSAFDAAVTATSRLTQAEERLANARRVNGSRAAVESAEAEVARLRLEQAGSTVALAEAQRTLNAARGAAPQLPEPPSNLPTPPVPTAPPGAPPRVTAGGGGGGGRVQETEAQREANRLLSQSYRDLTKIMEGAADPQIRMQAALGDVTRAIMEQDRAFAAYREAYGRAPADIAPLTLSLQTLTSVAEKAAEDVAKAMQGTGASTAQITAAITANVTAFAEELARTGRITTEQIGSIVTAAQNAGRRATGTGFGAGFAQGAGVDLTRAAPDFVTELGKGFGQIGVGLFDKMATSLDKVATGAQSAGDAMKEFALDFIKAVTMMIAKAAALAALNALIRAISGPSAGTSTGGVQFGPPSPFGGGFAAGGTITGGKSYLVGELGPELFVPHGSGRIVPNDNMGGVNLQIVNNAPGVVVEQKPSTGEVIEIAVNMARQRVASDFNESARTGFGAYAESLGTRYAMRRKL